MRVVPAEDLFPPRDGLVRLLEAYDFEIAAAVESGPEPNRAPGRERPGPSAPVLSPHVEQLHARELLADGTGGVGHPPEDRGCDAERVAAVCRVAAGGTAMGPRVIRQLLTRRETDRPVGRPAPREREVMELMAQGRSNAAVAARLVVTERAVAQHTSDVFSDIFADIPAEFGPPPPDDGLRRVPTVLAHLDRG
ncbi:response regulator transcription factor [Streptomyces megasporus]|uniref:response regulator transcription factor n=1 Tax=Streptomyces megasporus TaxID=44060 RepID=UPI0004E0BE54|nr:LuxR C-terminal-related transcriptional regulator [Streptomyces megasporus]